MSVAKSAVNSNEFDYEEILRNWDVKAEQEKADFLDILYDFYKPANHSYTGLYQQFSKDLTETFRSLIVAGDFKLDFVVPPNDPDSPDCPCEPLCDI